MNERDWQRLERRLVDAHVAADPPLSREIWHGVEGALAARPTRRGRVLGLGLVVATAAAVVLWLLPGGRVPRGADAQGKHPSKRSHAAPAENRAGEAAANRAGEAANHVGEAVTNRAGEVIANRAGEAGRAAPLNAVLETTRAVTFAMAADGGRIEVEPCKGRFVNVTVLDSVHHSLELPVRAGRVEVRLDGGAVMRGGVAHVLVPADTHLVVSTKSGAVVVRGLGGAMEIDTQSGEVRVDSAPRLDPVVTITSDSGAIAWQGRCGRGCRVDARSRTGDVVLRAPDPSVFARGAARGQSQSGRVYLEELSCTDMRCSSPPLPWRQVAPGNGH